MSLNGKNAVVTGGGRGLGRAIATVLAAQGAAVAVWDLNKDGAEETVEAITAAGGRAIAVAGDAADAAAVAESAARTREELGAITVLVNNAGITNYVPFKDLSEETWDQMMRINLKGPFLVTREFVPDMLEAEWGRIVNISSSSAQTGAPALGHYAASKGGVIGLTVDTPLLREGFDLDKVAEKMPMKRPGKPEDIAYAVAYLVSEEAAYVTGQTLSVNGGRYLV